MAGRKDKPEIIMLPDKNGWMATFSDMVTLLITFFVLLISMQSMDDKAFKESFGFFNDAMGPLEKTNEQAVQGLPTIVSSDNIKIFIDSSSLSRSLLNAMEQKNVGGIMGKGIRAYDVRETSRGLAIMLTGDVLFESGSATLSQEAYAVLAGVVSVLKTTDSMISVEGHTDVSGNDKYNWKLSMDRAMTVLNYFIYEAGMSPTKFAVAGYGGTRPIDSNETDQGRRNNRRVELVLLKDRF